MHTGPALPRIEASKDSNLSRVDWNYQEVPESDIPHRKIDDLSVFIEGALVGMGIFEKQIICSAERMGTVKSLNETTDNQHTGILKYLLCALATSKQNRIYSQLELPAYLRR